jgi:ATP-dependent DNA ligase
LITRNEKDRTSHYPDLTEAILRHGTPPLIADGEIVAFDGDVTSFSRLQARMQNARPSTVQVAAVRVYFYLFDLIWFDGYDLSALPLDARKSLLREAFAFDDPIRFSEHLDQDGESAFRAACEKGWEGLVAKRAASPYAHARSKDWLKFKCSNEQEFIVIGWTEPHGARSGLGALLVGYYEDGDLRFGGKVGTGFVEQELTMLSARLRRLERSTSPLRDQGDCGEGCALGATTARGTGGVRGMDAGWQASAPSLPRPSRRQVAGAGRSRARMTP